nr:zinc finger, CCHC-type, retrotransposon Gag domain protein [Tanacetum cinerariifolium]
MHSRLDWLCTSLRVMHLLSGKPKSKPKERLKREYHSIRQTDTETSTEFMQRFLRLAGFLRATAGTEEERAKNFWWGLRSHRNHGHNNDRHGSDRRGSGDNHCNSNNNYSGNNNSPGVPLRATPTRSALRVDADTQESIVELLADKKPGASSRVFAITEDHATKTLEHHATIDCRSYRVIFGDIHAPEFLYHGSLPGKSM